MSIENSPAKTLSASRATPESASHATPLLPPRHAPPAQDSPAQAPPLTQPWVTVATAPPRRPPRSSPPAVHPHEACAEPLPLSLNLMLPPLRLLPLCLLSRAPSACHVSRPAPGLPFSPSPLPVRHLLPPPQSRVLNLLRLTPLFAP